MIFVNDITNEDTYSLYDVFPKENFFYKGSIIRIVGYETPASIFYIQNGKIKIRFKKVLEVFLNKYQDPPFNEDPNALFYDVKLTHYISEEPMRRLKWAISEYKRENPHFSCVKLFPTELEAKLNDTEQFIDCEESFDNEIKCSEFYDASCLFFPVDIDAVITEFLNKDTFQKSEAMLVYFGGKIIFGNIGFDSWFYALNVFTDKLNVYDLSNGIKQVETPKWLNKNGFGYTFLRNYIVCPDNDCYSYEGKYLDINTKHHKNVRFLNDVIKLLRKDSDYVYSDTPYLQLIVPRDHFDISIVESIVVPHLESKGALNKTAWEHFKNIKTIIEKVGLSADFERAFRNILDLNKSQIYGGSKRNICSEQLAENLRKLNKRIGNDRMAVLLEDEVQLKYEIAKMNKVNVVEIFVSEEAFSTIKFERKAPKELKDNSKWTSLQAGTFIVFSNKTTNERFVAITTNTKSGLSLNRV